MFLAADIGSDGRGPGDDFWFGSTGRLTGAGVRVSPESAMRVAAVYACVKVISETVAMLPGIVYRRRDDDGKERVRNHPVYRLIHRQPNDWQTAIEWREMMQAHCLLSGNAYSEIITARSGKVQALLPLHPDYVSIERLPDRRFRYLVRDELGGQRILLRSEMFHLRGRSYDSVCGVSAIEEQAGTVGAALATNEYGARFFKNDATPPSVIEWDGSWKDEEAQRRFRDSWQASQTGANRGKTAVLTHGMKLKPIEIKNTDAQWIEARKFSVTEICRIFRVPPHKIADLERSTNNNIEHQSIEFVTDCIMPWLVRWEQAIDRDLLESDELFTEFLVDMLLRGDTASRYSAFQKAIQSGWMTRNEARAKENLNPLPGLDEPLEPMNMQSAGDDPEQGDRQQQPGNRDDRAARLAQVSADRVVRKEILALGKAYERCMGGTDEYRAFVREFYRGHARTVEQALAVSEAAANAWCAEQCALVLAEVDEEISTGHELVKTMLESWCDTRASELAGRNW